MSRLLHVIDAKHQTIASRRSAFRSGADRSTGLTNITHQCITWVPSRATVTHHRMMLRVSMCALRVVTHRFALR